MHAVFGGTATLRERHRRGIGAGLLRTREDHAFGNAVAGCGSSSSSSQLGRSRLPADRLEAKIDLRVAENHTFTGDLDRLLENALNSSATFNAVKLWPGCSLAFRHCIGHELWSGVHQDLETERSLWKDSDVARVGLFENRTANVSELPNGRNGNIRDLAKTADEFYSRKLCQRIWPGCSG